MKILSLLLLTMFLGKGCENVKTQDVETAVIEYTANTRGSYQKIMIKNKMVTVSKDRNGNDNPVAKKISDTDWNELVSSFEKVKLENLSKLKAPTEKRFYDGASIANLKITFKEKTYESASFDHGFPPKEIKKLVTKINSISKKE